MNEFNGKQFYGFSMNSNTKPVTQSRNFDFQHIRPEYLQQKVSNSNITKNTNSIGSRNFPHRPCIKSHTERIIHQRDEDIETQIESDRSTDHQTAGHYTSPLGSNPPIRELTDQEIEDLLIKAKTFQNTSSKDVHKCYQNFPELIETQHVAISSWSRETSPLKSSKSPRAKGILKNIPKDTTFITGGDLNQTYNVTIPATSGPIPQSPKSNGTFCKMDFIQASVCKAQRPEIIENVKMEEYLHPQWVKIEQPQRGVLEEQELPCDSLKFQFDCDAAELYMDSTMPLTEVMDDNIRSVESYVNVNSNDDIPTLDTYVVEEESDLEFEMIDRQDYMKYIEPRPLSKDIMDIDIDNDGSLAEFIAIENRVNDMDVTYLRSASPIDYTEDTQDDNTPEIKIYINGKENIAKNFHLQELQENSIEICDMPKSRPSLKSLQENKRKTKSLREQHLQRTFERLAAGGSGNSSYRSHTNCSKSLAGTSIHSQRSSKSPTVGSSSHRVKTETESITHRMPLKKSEKPHTRSKSKQLQISKSIEDLKMEKSSIYKKMSATQEKIIEVLDKLRIDLLDLNVPDNSLEKTKRQRNAFEFAVRFSRNFLYPLKGMLEDIKSTPIEQFNSLTSNEACLRVCHLYGLILQSVNTYHKQLRYFLLDHVPQKLPILIEMIFMVNAECWEKQIFSRQDIIVDSLQERCSKFFDFLQDFEEERLKIAKENKQKLTLDKALPKYDLKMFMNNLNMYEPKLVPKAVTHRKKAKPKRPVTAIPIDDDKDFVKEKPNVDNISTHVEDIPIETKSSTTQFNLGAGDAPGLDKNVIEALQNLTKDQVHKVLQPILASLGSALEKQNTNSKNPQAIEEILETLQNKVFSTLAGEKQLSSDNKCSKEENTGVIAGRISSVDNLNDTTQTSKPLKTAKQTKIQSQQNTRRSAKAPTKAELLTSATTREGSSDSRTVTKANVGNDEDVDGDDDNNSSHNINRSNKNNGKSNNTNNNNNKQLKINNNNKNNNNNVRQSNGKRNSMPNRRDQEREWSRVVNEKESSKINKFPNNNKKNNNLMNEVTEDQIYKTLQKTISATSAQHETSHHDKSSKLGNSAKPKLQINSHTTGCSGSSSIPTSDSEAGHNPKLKNPPIVKHSKSNRQLSQRSSSAHSQCQQYRRTNDNNNTQSNEKKKISMTASVLSTQRRNASMHCLTTKANHHRKKHDTPPAPTVTPSSSGHLMSSRSRKSSHQGQRISGDKHLTKISPNNRTLSTSHLSDNEVDDGEEIKIPLTAKESDLMSIGSSYELLPHPPISPTQWDNISDSNGNLADHSKHQFVRTPSGAKYVELYKNKISERLLNEVLETVENDFNAGVSKFVEDFLDLEIRTK
ncbi:uncharacterized protein LOC142230536 isoform X2 [Haematobia irritans]|uniref:uncharacterized protein LOC142230536 isoform X2 n=1 Tax=Haematobia irritans TaxID=7368 RepID=UPI003F508D6B